MSSVFFQDINISMRLIELINTPNPVETLVDFVGFACQELGITSVPKIEILPKPLLNPPYRSFAAYQPGNKSVKIYTKNRHILDILRSLCHEIVHYRQDLSNELNEFSGKTGSDQENEANALAGQIMRKYGQLHPELF